MIATPFGMGVTAAAGRAALTVATTSLLLHFDGTNGATTTTDSSPLASAVTLANGASLSTTTPKFGSACLLLDGTDDRLTLPYHATMHNATADFSFDAWVLTSAAAATTIVAVGNLGTLNGQIAWTAIMLSTGRVRFAGYETGSGGASFLIDSTATINNGAWRHVAVSRQGSTFRLFIDGALEGSSTFAGSLYSGLSSAAAPGVVIGAAPSLSQHWAGRIDEARIVSGSATFTGAFTPPTSAYP